MTLASGTRLGPYEIVESLGAGGMGEVYRAHDPRLRRDVAVKVILEAGDAPSRDRLQRFEDEARAVAALSHPNVLTVFDVGSDDGRTYVVFELLEGETLREALRGGALPQRRAVDLGIQICRGLEAAHARNLIHRDLKPENLFLTSTGLVKILDFGLAKLVLGEGGPVRMGAEGSEVRTETAPGKILGTIGYLSPEQVRGQEADTRSDLFALGAVLYEMLTGKRAFSGPTPADSLSAILHQEPPPLATGSGPLPVALDRVVRRCLEKKPEDRFHTAHDVALSLEVVGEAPSPSRGSAFLEEDEERSPYPGLRSFTEEDASRFFGREGEAEALWQRLKTRRLQAVIGPSGAGKTSFVRAGLVASRPSSWGALVSTPGGHPLRTLGQALAPELASDPRALKKLLSFEDPETAFELVVRWRRRHGEALLAVDQFEELFTQSAPEEQAMFAAFLGRLARDGDVRILLSLRDDFLMHCGGHEALAKVFTELTPLLPLGRESLRRALVEPARREGYAFEDDALVDEIIDSVEGARGALPLLAFAVSRLWEKRDREKRLLTRAAYEEIGGVAGALAQHAEQTLERIGAERQPLVREIFRNLVTAEGTRAAAEREEILSIFAEQSAAADDVLEALIDARLLSQYELPLADDEDGAQPGPRHRLEIVHESLLKAWPRLVRWQAQDEEGAVLRDQLRQAARLWEGKGRADDLLWAGTSEREFELWRERYPGRLTALEEEYASAMVGRARRRRWWRRLAVAGIVAASLAVAAIVAVSRQHAVEQARRAEAAQLLALAEARLDDDPTEALAYATAGLELADSEAARDLVLRSLSESPPAQELPVNVTNAAHQPTFSPDGEWLAAAGFVGEALVWGASGEGPLRLEGHVSDPGCGNEAHWAGSGLLVTGLACGQAEQVHVWSLPGGNRLRTIDFERPSRWQAGLEDVFAESGDPEVPHRVRLRAWRLSSGEERTLGVVDLETLGVSATVTTASAGERDGGVFEPGGTVWVYGKGSDVLVKTLPVDDRSPDRRWWRHRTEVRSLGAFRRATDGGYSRDASGELRLFGSPATAEDDVVVQVPSETPDDVRPGPSGRWVVGPLEKEGEARLWDRQALPGARPLRLRRSGRWFVPGHDIHPAGAWLVVPTHSWQALTFWPLRRRYPIVVDGYEGVGRPVAFTADSRLLVTSWPDGTVRLWPLPGAGPHEVRSLPRGDGREPVGRPMLAVDPHDRFVVVVGQAGQAFVVPLDGRPARRLEGFSEQTALGNPPAVSPNGRLVAAISWFGGEKTLRIWDLESGETRAFTPPPPPTASSEVGSSNETGFEGRLGSIAFLDDSTLLTGGDGGVRRWDLETGTHEVVVSAEWGIQLRFVVSADRSTVITQGQAFNRDETWFREHHEVLRPRLLDLETGESQALPQLGGFFGVYALDTAGEVMVTVGILDGILRVGRVSGSAPSHVLIGHESGAQAAAISPDGRWVATSGEDNTLRLWPMPDLDEPPLHALPHDELLAKLRSLTNLRAVRTPETATGWTIELDPFPGWRHVPTW